MTDQNDRQDESLTGQVRDQPEHCLLTGHYFQPCHSRLFIAMIENLTKSMSHMACFLFGSCQWVVERQHFYQATQNGR